MKPAGIRTFRAIASAVSVRQTPRKTCETPRSDQGAEALLADRFLMAEARIKPSGQCF